MKTIKLKENYLSANSTSYITDYLCSLGIAAEDISSFIDKPHLDDEDNPFDLTGLAAAILLVRDHCTRPDAKIFVQVDSDTDGYTSAAILINYLYRRFPNVNIEYRLHNGKEHGVIVDTVPAGTTLVIIPDAGSNQSLEVAQLVEKNIAVVILDHHEVNAATVMDFENVVLVNNQISNDFSNKNMSGAGIAYMFCLGMDKQLFTDVIAHDYRDLAAVGIIADAMNMTSLGNNFLAYYGLSNIKNQFIKEVAIKQARGIPNIEHLTKIGVAFYIAPVINGVIRSGDVYDKKMVFRAMVESNCEEVFVHEWRGKTTNETLYQHAARLAVNAKSRQDSGKKKSFEWLCSKIEENGWDKDNLIIVTMDEKESAKVNANVTGLIAMELVKYYNKPCLVLRETEFAGRKMYGGSGRNGNFFGLSSLLDFLHRSNLVYYAEGHANAHGCFLEPEKVQALRDYANTQINPRIFDDTVFEVDYWFHTGEKINADMLYEFASYDGLYGNSIPQPKFAFDINFAATDVKLMGKDNASIRLTVDNIGFIAFSDKDLAAQLTSMTNGGHAQIVGRAQLNEWMGNTSVQVMIDDIQLSEILTESSNKINILSLI